jgi:putative ABC transport system substrate-binding protein
VAIFHRAASYVDQTLRGVSPGELPVQANLRAAGAISLTLPPNLIARADEVIE